MSAAGIHVALVLMLILPTACTTIGPSAPMAPGPGKSAEAFASDRAACMADTDATVQPMANRLNLVPRGPEGVAADNARIQVAYDRTFGACMGARGNVPQPAAKVVAASPGPVAYDQAADASAPGASDRGPAADAFRRWFVTRGGCFDRSGSGRERRCSLADNLEGFTLHYGDAGHGRDGDVLVLATITEDPTANGDGSLVGIMRREGGRYGFVKEFPDVRAFGLAPGTAVRFAPGRVSFVGLTNRDDEGRNFRTGHTSFVLGTE